MNASELTLPVGEFVRRLKSASGSIEADVLDALDNSPSQEEFIERAQSAICSLIGECHDWLNHFQRAEKRSNEKAGSPNGCTRVSS